MDKGGDPFFDYYRLGASNGKPYRYRVVPVLDLCRSIIKCIVDPALKVVSKSSNDAHGLTNLFHREVNRLVPSILALGWTMS